MTPFCKKYECEKFNNGDDRHWSYSQLMSGRTCLWPGLFFYELQFYNCLKLALSVSHARNKKKSHGISRPIFCTQSWRLSKWSSIYDMSSPKWYVFICIKHMTSVDDLLSGEICRLEVKKFTKIFRDVDISTHEFHIHFAFISKQLRALSYH